MASVLAKMCKELSYRLRLPAASFDIGGFTSSLKRRKPTDHEWARVVLKAAKEDGFHCHVSWRPDRDNPEDVQLQVDFHRWKSESKTPLAKPTTEEVYAWVGRFTPLAEVEVHVHAEIRLKAESWQVTVLPLPWKLPYGEDSPTVDGVSFDLHSPREGIKSCYAHSSSKSVMLQLFGSRKLVFQDFDLAKDIEAFASVAKSFVGERPKP